MTATATSRVLVIEDNPDYLRFVDHCITSDLQWETVPAPSMARGVECLTREGPAFGLILLDLTLPDGAGLSNLRQVLDHCGSTPVLILTGEHDGHSAMEAVRDGADDYLVKQELSAGGLVRAIRNSLQRRHAREKLIGDPLVDELTGLHNRRAFLALANQQIAIARRARQSIALLIGDLEGLQQINDLGGREAGDQALIFTARVMRTSFRDSDVIARLRGDEFAVLMAETSQRSTREVMERFDWRLASRGLRMTVGMSRLGPPDNIPLDTLMILADEALLDERKILNFPNAGSSRERRGPEPDVTWLH
jgi:diguanylate cyclase (GGDEF)-like protein